MSNVGKSTSISGSAGSVVTSSNDFIEGMAATIFFFVVVIFFAMLYLYTKHVWGPNRRSRLIFASYGHLSLPRCGLSSACLEGLPITVFQSAVGPEEKLECAVCLSELRDGEQVRMLPKCSHGFHLECIDEWFQSQSTCPLCRSLVEMNPTPDSSAVEIPAPEAVQRDGFSSTQSPAAVLPANMLAAAEADLSMASSSVKRDQMLVIEIPRQAMEGFSLPSTSATISERMKTPTSARRRSLTRQLSQEKRTVVSSAACTGGSEDIEQGLRGTAGESWRRILPRIPRNS